MCGFVAVVFGGLGVCLVRVFRGVGLVLHRRGERVLNAHPSRCHFESPDRCFVTRFTSSVVLVLALACSLADCLSRSGGLCGGHGGSTHVSVCEARTLQGVYANQSSSAVVVLV
jgi:hypothetical protein